MVTSCFHSCCSHQQSLGDKIVRFYSVSLFSKPLSAISTAYIGRHLVHCVFLYISYRCIESICGVEVLITELRLCKFNINFSPLNSSLSRCVLQFYSSEETSRLIDSEPSRTASHSIQKWGHHYWKARFELCTYLC